MFRNHSFRDILPKSALATRFEDEERVYICDFCVKSDNMYYSETEVEDHKKIAHTRILRNIVANPLGCMTCFKIAPNRDCLVKHIKTEHLFISETANKLEHLAYICDYCQNVFFNKLMLEAHIKKYHFKQKGELKSVICPVCIRKIKARTVWLHFHNHRFQSSSICQICAHKCRDREALREHAKTHPRQYCCEACGFDSEKREFYEKHLLRHPTKTTSMMIDYKKYFTTDYARTNLHRIMIGANVSKVLRICILCRYICVENGDMKRHIFSVHMREEKLNDDPKKPVCSCGEEFFNKILLKQHIFRLKGDHRPASEKAPEVAYVTKELNVRKSEKNKSNNESFHTISKELDTNLVRQRNPVKRLSAVGDRDMQTEELCKQSAAVEIEISIKSEVETDGAIVKDQFKVEKRDPSDIKSEPIELDWMEWRSN